MQDRPLPEEITLGQGQRHLVSRELSRAEIYDGKKRDRVSNLIFFGFDVSRFFHTYLKSVEAEGLKIEITEIVPMLATYRSCFH